jgi:DNA-binding transcriptional ArsR family regulator
MSADKDALGASPGKWNALVRRARLTDRQKLAALTVGSYADSDGTGIHVGAARFGVDMGVSYRTARRYLAWLREVGLIELVRAGNRRRGWSDEYRLILDAAKHAHLDIPEGDEYRKIVDEVNGANQSSQKGRRMRVQRSLKESADATDHDESSALTIESANGGYQRSFDRSISAHS